MKRALLTALLATAALPCSAAEFTVRGDKIYVLGTIEHYDDFIFRNKVEQYAGKPMKVVLHSYGGDVRASMAMGRFIKTRGWSTHVEQSCNSGCALVWLAGSNRTKSLTATVGMHASTDYKTHEISLSSNEQITKYLAELGYPEVLAKETTKSFKLTYLSDRNNKRYGVSWVTTKPQPIPKELLVGIDLTKPPGQFEKWIPQPAAGTLKDATLVIVPVKPADPVQCFANTCK